MAFSPFEGGRGDETFPQHPGSFIRLTPFKGESASSTFTMGLWNVAHTLKRVLK